MSLTMRRNWALRLSLVLNICVLLYVCVHLTSSGPWIEEGSVNWSGANVAVPLAETYGSVDNNQVNASQKTRKPALSHPGLQATKETEIDAQTGSKGTNSKFGENTTGKKGNTLDKNKPGLEQVRVDNKTMTEASVLQPITAKEAIPCNDKSSEPRIAQRGDYWVLYNYVPMTINVKCWESVTYTTHADYTFLDNLVPLLERWRAPISIAMHAPGTDFQRTVDSIKYARDCSSPLVSQLVTFHIYFSSKHVPKVVPPSNKVVAVPYNCTLGPPWAEVVLAKMYINEKKLLYPVNVGRNIARESAPTHYVLPSDIELYPSPNLSSIFLGMIMRRDQTALFSPNPKVFVLSIFEVDKKSVPPTNKTTLVKMLKNGSAVAFHKKLCSGCHNVPKSKEWQDAPQSSKLSVFHVGKRTGKFVHWEPIFIGTNADPLYDERLSWEGRSDKMTQGYALCVLNYDFLILNDAFLVHRPGIKTYKKDPLRDTLTAKTNLLIKKIIVPELKVMYGTRAGCAV